MSFIHVAYLAFISKRFIPIGLHEQVLIRHYRHAYTSDVCRFLEWNLREILQNCHHAERAWQLVRSESCYSRYCGGCRHYKFVWIVIQLTGIFEIYSPLVSSKNVRYTVMIIICFAYMYSFPALTDRPGVLVRRAGWSANLWWHHGDVAAQRIYKRPGHTGIFCAS